MSTIYYRFVKRGLDIFISALVVCLLFPFFLFIGILIKCLDGGSIFYKQERVEKSGAIFLLLKFRTMTERENRVPGESGEIKEKHPEITLIGNVLRRFKVDELPQLINVFLGDMSLIGPRPCLPDLANLFDENGNKRLLVRPGCTGLSQINGNIYHDWPERWKYDAYYVDNLCFYMDLKIIFKTILVCVFGEKRYHQTYNEFKNGHTVH
jgi:lipopolysaccharide/colanic/teichoic acid biosynthesis glycosyltransferase